MWPRSEGSGRRSRLIRRRASVDPPTERDEISEPNWGSGSNGGDASPGDLCETTEDAADKGDPEWCGPSAMAEGTKHATWEAYVPGPTPAGGLWLCPACRKWSYSELSLQFHVWALAGKNGHPSKEEQDLWYQNETKGPPPRLRRFIDGGGARGSRSAQ